MPVLFGEKLRALRHFTDVTQSVLAQELGLSSHSHISKVEASQDRASLVLAIRVARYFAVSTDYLLRDTIPVYPILLALNNNPIQSRTDTALFSDRIRTLRLHRNITQHTLAASIGLSQGAISNLEAGRKSPSADLVVQIANVFGVTTDYLLQGTFLDEDLEIDGKLRG